MFLRWSKLGFLIPSRQREPHAPADASRGEESVASPGTPPQAPATTSTAEDEDARDDRVTGHLQAFRKVFKRELASACGIDVTARGQIHVLTELPARAMDWIPGENWSGPNAQLPNWGLNRTDLLRCTHVESFIETYSERPHTKGRASLRALLAGGNSLVICTPDVAALPRFMNEFSHTVIDRPINIFPLAMKALRNVIESAGTSRFTVSVPGREAPVSIAEAVDGQGRIRAACGWVAGKCDFRSLTMLLLEIEFFLLNESVDIGALLTLRLDTSEPAAAKDAGGDAPADPEVAEAPMLDEMAGIRRIRKRVRRLMKRSMSGHRKGILMHGPPGTGKTMLARTMAKETGRNIVVASFGEWQSTGDGHLGTTLGAMKASFQQAKEKQPSILFIDELDSLGSREDGGRNASYMRAVINGFLDLMDGFRSRGDVLVIGATNDISAIDPAILRHGRFGDHLEFPPADMEDVAEIIDWYLGKALGRGELPSGIEPSVTGRALSLRCFTESAATVRAIVEEAVALSQEQEVALSLAHFNAAMASVGGQDIEDEQPRPEDQLYRTAIHEAGHALAIHLLFGDRAKIGLATIQPAMGSLGHVVWEFRKGHEPAKVSDAAGLVVVALAGRCAEMIHGGLGSLGFGAGSDLRQARKRAEHLVTLGLLPSRCDAFVDRKDAKAIRKAANDWLEHLHGETMTMLSVHADQLRQIADELFRRRDLEESDLETLFTTCDLLPGGHKIRCA